MKNKINESRRLAALATYMRTRESFESVCNDVNLPCEDYMKRFPVEGNESLSEGELKRLVDTLNRDLRLLIKGLYLEDWKNTIYESFEESKQADIIDGVEKVISCDPANARKYFSKTNALLKLLNNPDTREQALLDFEIYCQTKSFQDLVNDYDLAFKSIHAEDLKMARERGWEKTTNPGFGERKKGKCRNYFNASEQKKNEDPNPSQFGME